LGARKGTRHLDRCDPRRCPWRRGRARRQAGAERRWRMPHRVRNGPGAEFLQQFHRGPAPGRQLPRPL